MSNFPAWLPRKTLCDYCLTHSWVGPPCQRISRPYPDHTMLPLYKYKHVLETPREIEGKPREVDDFQSRVKIKESVQKGTLSTDDQEALSQFCDQYIVDKPLVIECIEDIKFEEISKQERKEARKERSDKEDSMDFKDFDWRGLMESKKTRQTKS